MKMKSNHIPFLILLVLGLTSLQCRREFSKEEKSESGNIATWDIPTQFGWSTIAPSNLDLSQSKQGESYVLYNENAKVLFTSNTISNPRLALVPEFQYQTTQQRIIKRDKQRVVHKKSTNICNSTHAYDREISAFSEHDTISNERVILTAETFGRVTVLDNAELVICSDVEMEDILISGGGRSKVTIAENAVVNCSENVSQHYELDTLLILGELNTNGFEAGAGLVKNYGSLNTSYETYINKKGGIENYGDWNTTALKVSGRFLNYGSTYCSTIGVIWSSGTVENHCKLETQSNLNNSGTMINTGLIKSNYFVNLYSGSTTSLFEGSHVKTVHFEWRGGHVENYDQGAAFIEIASIGKIFEGSTKTGLLDICDKDGINKDDEGIYENCLHCQTSISTSNCNTEGYTPAFVDSDNDGVHDELDPEPSNPQINGVNQYPIDGKSYFCFEDLWPYTADYDFNDLVLSVIAKNLLLDNEIKKIELTIVFEAIGGSLPYNLAFRPIIKTENPSEPYKVMDNWFISTSVGEMQVGDYIKLRHDIPRSIVPYYSNTGIGPTSSNPDTLKVTVEVKNIPGNELIFPELFLVSTENFGREIHLKNLPPTKLANEEIFNTGQDASSAPYWYQTINGLPWGIEVATTESFYWTSGKNNISDAYPQFESWAKSSGKTNSEWFKYPDGSYIFKR